MKSSTRWKKTRRVKRCWPSNKQTDHRGHGAGLPIDLHVPAFVIAMLSVDFFLDHCHVYRQPQLLDRGYDVT